MASQGATVQHSARDMLKMARYCVRLVVAVLVDVVFPPSFRLVLGTMIGPFVLVERLFPRTVSVA